MKAALLALMLAAPLPALAADPVRLMLDWFVNPDHGPIVIAQENGYFREAGLEVEVIAPADPSDPPKMVAAGQADIAIGYQPQLHLQVHEGLPLKRIGTLIATPLNCLLVNDDGPVKTLADLRGRKIGYSVAGVEEALVTALLAPSGLTLKDVEMVNVNWSLSPALLSGQVDAVIGAFRNFELTQMALAGGKGRCFYLEEEGLPAYDELIFLANPERTSRDVLNRFLGAVEKGAHFIANHPETAWTSFSATAPDLSDELNRRAWEDTRGRFSQSPAALDAGRYARFEAFLKDHGLIDSILPVADLALDPGAAE